VMLSETAATVLRLIAAGRSYDQILQQHPELTYFDIFAAAREALDFSETAAARQPLEQAAAEPLPIAPEATGRPSPPPAPTVDIAAPMELPPPTTQTPGASAPKANTPEHPETEPARASFIDRARATHARAWARWTREEDARLTALFAEGMSRAAIARELERQPGAVRSRLLKLGLISETDASDGTAVADDPVPAAEALPAVDAAAPGLAPVPGWEAFRARLTDEPASP
jgi:hypothetical protein